MRDIKQIGQREAGLPKVFGRHQMAMVAVGAIISYGLMTGAGFPLSLAGPGVVVSYLAASVVVLLMAYCLAEMAARHPMPGAFGSYAEAYLGAGSGFVVRSAYVVGLLCIIGTEMELLGSALAPMLPGLSATLVSVLGLIAIIGVNLLPAQWFARLEFTLSAVKVAALLFFVGCAWRVFFQSEAAVPAPQSLQAAGDLLYWHGILEAFILAVLGYAGMESLAVAAGETAAAPGSIRRVIRTTAWVLIGLALAVVVAAVAVSMLGILPLSGPPMAFILRQSGVPLGWMNIAIAVAVLSVLNSQLYGASRMLFSLGRAERRLHWLGGLRGGSPRIAVLVVGVISLLVFAFFKLYMFQTFIAATTIASSCLLLVWLMVFFSYLRFRQQAAPLRESGRALASWPAWGGVVLVVGVALSTWRLATFELTLMIGGPFLIVLCLVYTLFFRLR